MARLRVAAVLAALLLGTLDVRAQSPGELRLEDARHRLVIRVEPKGPGYLLWDGDGTPLGDLTIETDRVHLRDATGVVRWTIRRKDFGPQIETATGERLYRMRKRPDEWRLEDATKVIVTRIHVRANGEADIRDERGAATLTVKHVEHGFLFATETGHRVAEVAGPSRVAAGLWFGVERFSPAERAAMWAYFASLER
ncbi:MAG TPA: hypothetical protein VFL90_01155 [Methylomirabilota bacterium]|nr:hypothetical protein [Methylomirabilota bacterium]